MDDVNSKEVGEEINNITNEIEIPFCKMIEYKEVFFIKS